MAKSGAMIHIVCADSRPDKLLKQVIIFIGNFGAGKPHNSVRSKFFFDIYYLIRHQTQCLIPGCRLQLPVFSDQRSCQPAFMIDEIISKPPLDTKHSLIGNAISRFSTYYLSPFRDKVHLTTYTTIGAGCFGFFCLPVSSRVFPLAFHGTCRANADTHAAADTASVFQRLIIRWLSVGVLLRHISLRANLHTFLAHPDAFSALNAFVRVPAYKIVFFIYFQYFYRPAKCLS